MMVKTQYTLAIVLATFALSNAFHTLIPEGKEVIYNYEALVTAGTFYPAPFASQFVLHGHLHVQSDQKNNVTFVKLTDLKYEMYNGRVNHVDEHHVKEIQIDEYVHDLLKPFKILHKDHGNEIVTEKEKEFSRNIKKSIVTFMQMKLEPVMDHHNPHGFTTTEHSLYGMVKVNYQVLTEGRDVFKVQKMYVMPDMVQNTFPQMLVVPPVLRDASRKYTIVKKDDHYVVEYMEGGGFISYAPFNGKSDAHYINVNQSFVLDKIVPIQEPMKLESEHHDQTLTYKMYDDTDTEMIADITNGRHVIDYQKLMPQVIENLKDIVHYFTKNHINTEVHDFKKGQGINRIQKTLMYFDFQHLEELYTTIKQQVNKDDFVSIVDVYHHVLPIVGTKASLKMIKKLVVEKVVEDKVAITMLHNLPTNVLVPHMSMLEEMEPIIHMDETRDWSVRKAAILSFGALVNKVYEYRLAMENMKHTYADYEHVTESHNHVKNHVQHDEEHETIQKIEEELEKYIKIYAKQIREAKEYKVQIPYFYGLYNMKLTKIVGYLLPMVTGEWNPNNHIRLLALYAVSPAVMKDHDLINKIFWPIFINQNEHPELRIAAYFLIMQSQPSNSILLNIARQMLVEHDEELYHFHYTYVNTMINSVEPSRKDYGYRLSKLMKFMHPPSHGTSVYSVEDYQDMVAGFGGSHIYAFVNTNVSTVFSYVHASQMFHHYQEDYVVSVKVHGHRLDMTAATFEKVFSKLPSDAHIEVALVKHDYVFETYYVDHQNMHDLQQFLEFVANEDKQEIVSKEIDIHYGRYHKFLIPTDMGMPAIWEFLMPVVQTNVLNTNKEITNKIINVHFDNKYTHGIHIRHGLSVYNPITDVLHGIKRYHSHDMVVPMNFDISINPTQQSLKLSWHKSEDETKNVMGLRSHVTNAVFVHDMYNRGLLEQSSEHSKEFVVVTNGKEYRKEYVLVDEDILSTGHNWQVIGYDVEYHVANGTHTSFLHHVAQPYTKSFSSFSTYLDLVFANWHNFAILLPDPGVQGYLVKVEPSHKHDVSNIDLTIRFNQELVSRHNKFAPAAKYSARMTYAVKNKEQSLKTWDINTILDVNDGHTVNNLKMHLTRIVPGQKDYKVCVDGVKKWNDKGVTGHLNVAMSQTDDGKCVKDDTVIDITMVGEKSHEQEHEHHVYGACQYMIPYSVTKYYTLHCLAAQTSVRHYVYNVKTAKIPTEYKKTILNAWDHIKGYYMWHYNVYDEHFETLEDHHLKVDVLYPMEGHTVDVTITTPQHQYELSAVPTDHLQSFGFFPDTKVYTHEVMTAHNLGLLDHCIVHSTHYQSGHHPIVHHEVPKEWTLYATNSDTHKQAIYIKQVEDHRIAVKVEDKPHTVEVYPKGNEYKVVINGEEVTGKEVHNEWVSFFTVEDVDVVYTPVVLMMHQIGMHVELVDDHVTVVVPPVDNWQGQCYQH